ncbi:MAG: hypothetical protein DRJ01_06675 [Bacteroidetes bacterium]|nr:MAG: hypothetical protein DRJ01_06675 [Bacteroidota bacterium]
MYKDLSMYEYKDEVEMVPAEKIVGIECEDVLLEEFEEIKKLGEDMIEYCVEKGGLGLAAPQVGVKKNVFIWMNAENSFQIVLNPKIFLDKKKTNVLEGCLSYPDEQYFVQRSKKVRVRFEYVKDGELKTHFRNLTGEKAFIFQHEYDHLQGETIATKGLKLNTDDEDAKD